MSDKWEELLRKKLEDYEVEPPPGLWEGICEKMGIDPVTLEKKPAVSRWWWAVAAAVLALVGCFVVYEMSDSDQPLQADAVSQQQSSLLPSSEPVQTEQSPSQQQEDVVSPRSMSLISRSLSLRPNQGDRLLDDVAEPQSRTCPLDSASTEIAQQQDIPSEPQQQPSPAKPSEYEAFNDPEPPSVYEVSASQAKWSVALKASGGLLAANNSLQTDKLYQPMGDKNGSYYYDWNMNTGIPGSYNYYYNEKNPSTIYTVTEYVAKHHLPLRFGLSLQYQLNPRLALLSGISYTRLSSEFSFPLYQNISYSQKLHYIGIPLGVAWQLWTANRFSFYCSGGAMVEKCVSVSLNGDYSGKKPWQWSVNGAIGAEYAFTSLLGAYLEPSLGYYFSDGTQLEHYYKEHPLAPSIEFGLRMHLGR